MDKRITDINIIQHNASSLNGLIYGTYLCKFRGENKIFVRSNDIIYVLTHYFDKPSLDIIRDDVKAELIEEVEKILEYK